MANNEEKPLKKIAEAFNGLANTINSSKDVDLGPFSTACSLVSPLFGCLGIAFKFAEMDYVAKVRDLEHASKSIKNLELMIDKDIEVGCVRKGGSHTRNLLRVKRGLDMVRILFQQILATEGNSLKSPASTAYAQVFAPHHGWAIRSAVAAGMYALPTKAQLLSKLNEDDTSARTQMQCFVDASAPVMIYIDKLFLSRELGRRLVNANIDSSHQLLSKINSIILCRLSRTVPYALAEKYVAKHVCSAITKRMGISCALCGIWLSFVTLATM